MSDERQQRGLHDEEKPSVWQVLDGAISDLAQAHAEQRSCRSELSGLQSRQSEQLESGDEEGFEKTSEQLKTLMPRRKQAEERLSEASVVLERQTLALRQVEEVAHDDEAQTLFTEVAVLAKEAARSSDEAVAERLHSTTKHIREHLHARRESALRALVRELESICRELEEHGEEPQATRDLLSSRRHLDMPLSEARERLENERTVLLGRAEEVRLKVKRQRAERAQTSLLEIEGDGFQRVSRELDRVVELLGQMNAAPEVSEATDVGRGLLRVVADAAGPLNVRFDAWLRLVPEVWRGEASVERLEAVCDLLPRSPSSTGAQPAMAERLLDLSERQGASPDEYLPLIKELIVGQLEWAEAFFSTLFGDAAPTHVRAWWLIHAPRESTLHAVHLEHLFSVIAPPDRFVLQIWGMEHLGLSLEVDALVLFSAWAASRQPCPSLDQVFEHLAGVRHEPTWAGVALTAGVAILTGREHEVEGGLLQHLSEQSAPLLGELLATLVDEGRATARERLERGSSRSAASTRLDGIHGQRTTRGRPATTLWQKFVFPRLEQLRVAARDRRTRAEALEALSQLRPSAVIQDAIAGAQVKGINPRAKQDIVEWIEMYQELVPVEVAAAPVVPALLQAADPLALAQEEIGALKASGPLGEAAAAVLERLLRAPLDEPIEADDGQFSPRETYRRHLVDRGHLLTAWHFRLADDGAWMIEAALDVLERQAMLAGTRHAFRKYLQANAFEYAQELLDASGPEVAEELTTALDAAREAAYTETRAMIESFLLAPIQEALRRWHPAIHDDALRQMLEECAEQSEELLQSVDALEPKAAQERCDQLSSDLDVLLVEVDEKATAARLELERHLSRALKAGLDGRSLDAPSLLLHAYGRSLSGDLGDAAAALKAVDLPPDDPRRRALERKGPALAELPAPLQPPAMARPAMRVTTGDLSRHARSYLINPSSARIPDGFEADRPLEEILDRDTTEREELLLWSASRCYERGDETWTSWLAHWSVERGYSRASTQDFNAAEDHARDAVLLLASADTSGLQGWSLDEALVLWLASALERSGSSLHRASLPWDTLRGGAGVRLLQSLFQRFFAARTVDLLADLVVAAESFGGVVSQRLLVGLDDQSRHMRGALLREVLRGGATLEVHRVRAALVLLTPWIGPECVERLSEYLDDVTRDGALPITGEWERLILKTCGQAALDDEIISRIKEAFRFRKQRERSIKDEKGPTFNLLCRTKTFYLSTFEENDEADFVVEIRYTAGSLPRRDLKVQLSSFVYPSLRVAGDRPTVTVPVPLLRPGGTFDAVFPIVAAEPRTGEVPETAQATVELFSEHETGTTSPPIVKRIWKVVVRKEYPFLDHGTPYVTGKRVSKLTMIKGRDQETNEIIAKLKGQDHDNFVLIFGMRRIGKSSLLYKLQMDDRLRKRYHPIHLDLEYLLREDRDTTSSFLDNIARAIHERLEHPRAREIAPPALVAMDDPFNAFEQYLREVADALGRHRRLLLMFDEFQMLFAAIEKAKRSASYGSFRDALHGHLVKSFRFWVNQLPVAFIVAGTRELKRRPCSSPSSASFSSDFPCTSRRSRRKTPGSSSRSRSGRCTRSRRPRRSESSTPPRTCPTLSRSSAAASSRGCRSVSSLRPQSRTSSPCSRWCVESPRTSPSCSRRSVTTSGDAR